MVTLSLAFLQDLMGQTLTKTSEQKELFTYSYHFEYLIFLSLYQPKLTLIS